MASFKDRSGRTWLLDLDHATIAEIKRETGIDFYEGDGSEAISALSADPYTLINALYVACREQAAAAGLDDRGFGRAFNGEAIEAAVLAMAEALADFFGGRRGQLMRLMLDRMTARHQEADAQIARMIDSGQVAEVIDKALAGSSGATPASSASTPDPTPSGNCA